MHHTKFIPAYQTMMLM